jgi:type IV secretory pathway VirB9-like protein
MNKPKLKLSIALTLLALFLVPIIEVNALISKDLLNQEQEEFTEELKGDHIQKIFNSYNSTNNVVTFKYDPEKTDKINLRTGIATIINLPEYEKITLFILGDNKKFKAKFNKSIPNILELRTTDPNYDSNLIIKTDIGSIYNFYLRSYNESSEEIPYYTVYIIKDKNQEQLVKEIELLKDLKNGNDYLKKITSLDQLNSSYKISGDQEISPIYVYDDGKWTFFDFGKNFVSDRLPNIYKIVDTFDSVVNTRIKGNVLIAQSLSPEGWILKNGEKYICVKPKKSLYKIYKDERFKR